MWSTPSDRARAAVMDPEEQASQQYPSRLVAGHRLHVLRGDDGQWRVWLNTEVADFDGLCIGVGETYDAAVAQAVQGLEACVEALQGPRWFNDADF